MLDNWWQNHGLSDLSSKTSEMAWPNMAPSTLRSNSLRPFCRKGQITYCDSQYNEHYLLSKGEKKEKAKEKKVEHICIIREVFTSIIKDTIPE